MNKYKISSTALRLTLLIIGSMIFLGIWLTGFNVVHWLLYVPAIFLTFAAITGICPSLIVTKIIFKES